MPWPPTFATDFAIPLEYQLGAGLPAGLSPDVATGVETPTSGLDSSSGIIAPGALGLYDAPLDRIEELARMEQERKSALDTDDSTLAPLTDAKGKRAAVIRYAREKLGMDYVWGGESDDEGGYDCSGLLWYAFRKAGVDIPRVSMSQAERGKRVAIGSLQAGDFVAWENNARQAGADHIALYLGNGMILEAPRTGLKVRIRKLSAAEMSGQTGAWGVQLDY